MRKKRQKKVMILLVLMVVFSVFLTGCRESPVLEQLIYKQGNEIDYDELAYDRDNEKETEKDELLLDNRVDDSEYESNKQEAPVENRDGTDDSDMTYHLAYDEKHSDNNGESGDLTTGEDASDTGGVGSTGGDDAAQGMESSEDGTNNTQEKGTLPSDNTGTGNYGEGDESGNSGDSGGSNQGINVEPGRGDEYKQIVDARGREVDVPEDVKTIVAPGEAATMVEMLGGTGRLLASSESFTSSSWVNRVFGADEVSGIATWWKGTGNATISDENFSALLAAKPDVCFEFSGDGTYTNAQIAAMEEAGIAYVVLPELTKIENITQAVKVVGDVLGDRSEDGMTDAPKIAKEYSDFVERLLRNASGPDSMKLTVYIGAWDTSKYVTYFGVNEDRNKVVCEGYGAAAMKYGANINLSPYYMFSDSAYSKRYYDSPALSGAIDYALYYSGVINNGSGVIKEESHRNGYVFPMMNAYIEGKLQNVINDDQMGVGFSSSYFLLNNWGGKSMQNEINLGQSAFPAIVVADSSIKEAIEHDPAWNCYAKQDSYTMENEKFYWVTSKNNGILGRTCIAGDYDIYVNPSGVGSWADGSAESILETAWGTYKFWGDKYVSKSELQTYVKDFYSTFYHYDLTSSELAEILGE